MGENVGNVLPKLHGEGTTVHTPEIRLHYGDKSIDETHDMTKAIFRDCVKYRSLSQQTNFDTEFGDWIDDNATTPAKAEKAAFLTAAWSAL